MRTTFEIVTNSFANGYIRICFHPLPHVTYRPKAILSTDSPIVSAQEYDVHDLSAQRSSLRKFACVVVDESEVVLERCLLSKVFIVFHTAAVYSWIYTGTL